MAPELRDSPSRAAYLHLVEAHERLVGEFADLFRRHGTTQAQFNVLRILVQAPEVTATCQQIGERLIHRVPDVTRLIDRMEKAGLVTRARSESDRRVVLVRLTEQGRELCEGLYPEVEALHEAQFAHLDPAVVRRLDRALLELLEER